MIKNFQITKIDMFNETHGGVGLLFDKLNPIDEFAFIFAPKQMRLYASGGAMSSEKIKLTLVHGRIGHAKFAVGLYDKSSGQE